MEQEDRSYTQTEWNGTIIKEEREQNDLAEGPHSRMEWKDFKKFGTCPALTIPHSKLDLFPKTAMNYQWQIMLQ